MGKPNIFMSVGAYLPGFKGGGPTQSVKNMIDRLSDEYNFYIFTANHDFGDPTPYETVSTDQWGIYDDVNIFYSSEKNKQKNINNILKNREFSLIFFNGFFGMDTIRILLARKYLNIDIPVILMPRGELSKGALNIKKPKKMLYIQLALITGLLKGINFLTTAEDEFKQVKKILKTDDIYKVSNIPNTEKKLTLNTKVPNRLKIVFLSRVTQKKNLDYALNTLTKSQKNIDFDIYGPLEEKKYWGKCLNIIQKLPKNITVTYKGELRNEVVVSTLSSYDLFYFPTKSENYGHVISEALQSSIPVLTSDQTPWRNLKDSKFGWDYPLINEYKFIKQIDDLAELNIQQYNEIKKKIYSNFKVSEKAINIAKEYKTIINNVIEKKQNENI